MNDAEPKSKMGLSGTARKALIQRFLHHQYTAPNTESLKQSAYSNPPHAASNIPDTFCRFDRLESYERILISRVAGQRMGIANPFFRVHEGIANANTTVSGRSLINFSSYNYLGLSGHPRINEAAKSAIDRYGTSASASRLVAGERPIQRELEQALAQWYGVEDCIVFVSGHATNVTTIGCLFGPKDLVIHDSLIHNSILEGIKLSGAARRSFSHNNPESLETILSEIRGQFERVLIAIEGLYSMDGDIPDLPRFLDIKTRYKAFLMVDDAHSLGTLGANGGGVREHFNLHGPEVDIWMGTLSKTLAGCGGYICGSSALVDNLKYSSGGFVYSVGISPVLAAASLKALRILQAEPDRVTKLRERAQQFLARAKHYGMDTGFSAGCAIIPVIIKNSIKAVKLSNELFEKGINVQPIIHPAVEERSARLRFFLSCMHTEEQVRMTMDILTTVI